MKSAYRIVDEQNNKALQRQKKFYDRQVSGDSIDVGDRVMLYSPAVGRGRSKKFHRPWVGPYIVKKKITNEVFRIRWEKGRKTLVVHYNRLKPIGPGSKDLEPVNTQLPSSVGGSKLNAQPNPQAVSDERGLDIPYNGFGGPGVVGSEVRGPVDEMDDTVLFGDSASEEDGGDNTLPDLDYQVQRDDEVVVGDQSVGGSGSDSTSENEDVDTWQPRVTRSGRVISRPGHLKDYEL